jgi:hypothetical protein
METSPANTPGVGNGMRLWFWCVPRRSDCARCETYSCRVTHPTKRLGVPPVHVLERTVGLVTGWGLGSGVFRGGEICERCW